MTMIEVLISDFNLEHDETLKSIKIFLKMKQSENRAESV